MNNAIDQQRIEKIEDLRSIQKDLLSQAEKLLLLPREKRQEILSGLSEKECSTVRYDWNFWGRPEQHAPSGDDWDVWFLLGGRRGGKTLSGAEWVQENAARPKEVGAIIGETAAEVRDVMIEGPSGILATAKPWNPVQYFPSKRRLVWPRTGTWATTYSGDEPNQLRGPGVHWLWADEFCKFKYPEECWNQMNMILSAGKHPKACMTTTPRPIQILKDIISDIRTKLVTWSTYRNIRNVAKTFINRILRLYEGTTLGKQELHAVILDDTEGALWTQKLLDITRVKSVPNIVKKCVAVDPPGGIVTECGIVVVGLGEDGQGYVLDDMSIAGTPHTWASQVIAACAKHDTNIVVAETNHGGKMVGYTINNEATYTNAIIQLEEVHASVGKKARAQPVSSLSEQNRLHLVGSLGPLESELTTWIPDSGMDSPNRLDAMVWGVTYLMVDDGTKKKKKKKRAGRKSSDVDNSFQKAA